MTQALFVSTLHHSSSTQFSSQFMYKYVNFKNSSWFNNATDLIHNVPGIGNGSIIDFHSMPRPRYCRMCTRKCRCSRMKNAAVSTKEQVKTWPKNNHTRMPLPLHINQFSFQYLYFVTMRFTIDECPAVTSYSPTKTPLELNGALLAMWQ